MSAILVIPAPEPDAPPWSILIDDQGRAVGRGPWRADDARGATVILALPGAEALARWLDLPTRNDTQARAAAGFLLEDDLAAPRAETHLALGPIAGGAPRLVVAIARTALRAWLDAAARWGVRPEVVIPDHLLLPEPEDDSAIGVRIGGSIALRARGLAVAGEADLAPFLAGSRPLKLIEDSDAAERIFASGAARPVVNLLQGEFALRPERAGGWAAWRLPALLLGLALAAPIVTDAVRVARYNFAAESALAAAEASARAIGADFAASPDPVGLALQRLAQIDAASAGGFLGAAAGLFNAIEQTPAAQLIALRYAPDGALRASVSYATYADLERLRASLAQARLALEEGASATANGRITTEIVVRAAP